jgi:hypothetical protein
MEVESSIAFSRTYEHQLFYSIERLDTILCSSWRVLSDHRNPVDHPTGGVMISNIHIHQGGFRYWLP